MSEGPDHPAVQRRLAIVVSHPIQYYSPWFRWLAEHSPLVVRVFYLSDVGWQPSRDKKFGAVFAWDIDLTSGYDWELVPNHARHPDVLRFSGLNNPQLFPRLAAWRPDAILLFGYNYRTHLRLIAWCRWRGLPLIFRGDSHALARGNLGGLKRGLLRLLYAQFSALTYVGHANRDYFERCGVQPARLFFAPHAIDASRFDEEDPHTVAEAAKLRRSLEIPSESRVVLFAGKFIPAKQPVELLGAFLRINLPNTMLILVGDGPERARLEAILRERPDAPVRLLPFANQSEMPARYLLADLYALPSRGNYETWGLAVNEAMQLGRPALVSDQVGCQKDLVQDGRTGWVFAAADPASLSEKLREALAASPETLSALRQAAKERVSHYSYAECTRGLLEAFSFALGQGRGRRPVSTP